MVPSCSSDLILSVTSSKWTSPSSPGSGSLKALCHFCLLYLFDLLSLSDTLVWISLLSVFTHRGASWGLIHLFTLYSQCESRAWHLGSLYAVFLPFTCFLLWISPSCPSLRPFHLHCLESGFTITSPCYGIAAFLSLTHSYFLIVASDWHDNTPTVC